MQKKKVLLIRLDKIGDLICSLPVDQVLDESLYDVTWVVQKGLGKVVELGVKKRRFIELDKSNPKESAAQLRNLLGSVYIDVAISFQCPWWVNFELLRARIPIRAGVKSQWHSFLFLNQAVRQKRSLAEKHEFEYNLELVEKTLSVTRPGRLPVFEIKTPSEFNILDRNKLEPKKYIVVHPGMMGSALNWPQSEYISYIKTQLAAGKKVVITGTESDESYLTEIRKTYLSHQQVIWLQSKLNMNELVQVLAHAEFVVAPSTGVAHLAASVGTPVKAIFSPVTVHHPRRWAPRGSDVEIWMINVS